jgi:hypothetical protein
VVAKKFEHAILEPEDYCSPKGFPHTWKEDEYGRLLREASTEILPNFDSTNPRVPFVIALRLGTGNDKTHLLMKAAELLDAKGIYVAYNLGQSLRET